MTIRTPGQNWYPELFPDTFDNLADTAVAGLSLAAEDLAALVGFDFVDIAETGRIEEHALGLSRLAHRRNGEHAVLAMLLAEPRDKLALGEIHESSCERQLVRHEPPGLARAAFLAFGA